MVSSERIRDLECSNDGCGDPEFREDRWTIREGDGRLLDTTDGDPVEARCNACGSDLRAALTRMNIGTSGRRATTTLKNGVVVDSPDRTVCKTGREFVGSGALENVRPGETGICELPGTGIAVAATRSRNGGRVSVVRADDAIAARTARRRA